MTLTHSPTPTYVSSSNKLNYNTKFNKAWNATRRQEEAPKPIGLLTQGNTHQEEPLFRHLVLVVISDAVTSARLDHGTKQDDSHQPRQHEHQTNKQRLDQRQEPAQGLVRLRLAMKAQ